MFCSNKDSDSVIFENRANVVYKFTCPGFSSSYVGKTDRNLITRMKEHGESKHSVALQHLSSCIYYNEILNLYRLPQRFSSNFK